MYTLWCLEKGVPADYEIVLPNLAVACFGYFNGFVVSVAIILADTIDSSQW